MRRAHRYKYILQSSFSNLSVTSPMSQLILQPFRRFTYVKAHSPTIPCFTYVNAYSPTLPSLHLRHRSFSNSSVASPTSQIIIQPFRRFTYVTAHCLTLPSLHLRDSSLSNSYVASPTSQFILQPLPSLHLRHSSLSNPSVASPT